MVTSTPQQSSPASSQKLVLRGCYLAWVQPYAIHFEILKTVNLLTRCATTSLSGKLLHQDASQSKFLHCSSCLLVSAGDEPSRAGGLYGRCQGPDICFIWSANQLSV